MALGIIQRCMIQNFIKTHFKPCPQFVKFKSDAHIVMTEDTSTVVCWHPETHFPYEMSEPVPEKIVHKSDSVLKVQSNKALLSVFKPKSQEAVREELAKMTYTTKHMWYPPKHQFRRKKAPEKNRPYL